MTTLVKQVRQVAGVKSVKVEDFRKGHFSVIPKKDKKVSPRALWDAVIKAGFTPTKLSTGDHEHKKRPNS